MRTLGTLSKVVTTTNWGQASDLAIPGYTMSYDAAGNLTNDTFTGEGTRTYDAENRMKQAWANNQWQTYNYDGDGRRVKRIVNGVETWQVYGLGGELIAEYAANTAAATPQKEYGYRNGQMLITADAASGGGGSGAQPVTWTNAVGVTVNGNSLTTTGNGWNTAGAISTQTIASGDGYVEFTASETTTYRLIGLSNGDTNQNWDDIDFAIYMVNSGSLMIYEGAVSRGSFGTYATGDILRVAVEGGVVKYRKNGALLYTSTIAPTYPLLVDTSLYNYNSTINNAMFATVASGGGSTQNASWTNAVGVSVNGNSLTKTAASAWGNAGAVSTQTITSGDGYMEFTASETTSYRLIGLSNGDTNQNYDDIDFAIYLMPNGNLGGYVGATYLGILGTYATGDVLRVAIEGGVVKYKKNGTVFYTATAPPNYPLMVDTSLYTIGATINNVVISGAGSPAQIHWLVTDQLGTPRMIFDQSGALANVSRHDYLPFGEELFAGVGGRTAPQGYTLSDNVRQKFTQKERDNETGLDYFGARYYSSTQGRFTGADPASLELRHLVNPQDLNRYAYVANNPLKFIDPDGEEKIQVVIQTFIPQKEVTVPVVNRTFGGDDRNVGESGGFRTQQIINIETDPNKGGAQVGPINRDTGITNEFSGPGGRLIGQSQASGETLEGAVTRDESGVNIHVKGNESNPRLSVFGITYDLNIQVQSQGTQGNVTVTVTGSHDKFPAYEIMVIRPEVSKPTTTVVYQHDPRQTGNTGLSLIPGNQKTINPPVRTVIPAPPPPPPQRRRGKRGEDE